MDVIKIGRFIAERRKEKNLTQMELAEKLFITDRAVSKWECGKSMPDSSVMLELCDILGITVNELLTGERLKMDDYDKKAENNLVEITRQKEETDKRLLKAEIIIGIIAVIILFTAIAVGSLVDLPDYARIIIIFCGFIIFLIAMLFLVRIEQKAGYYECKKCHHRYVPTYMQTNFAMHINRTRFLRCPKCGKWSWSKKVISKDDE